MSLAQLSPSLFLFLLPHPFNVVGFSTLMKIMEQSVNFVKSLIYKYVHNDNDLLREAFQSKKQRKLGIWHLGGGGGVKKSKKSQVSVGKSSKLGGVLINQNSLKIQRVSKTEK